MKKLLIILILLTGCDHKVDSPTEDNSCRGEWSERVNGKLKKYREYWHAGLKACATEFVQLSTWEKTSEKRSDNNITCTPQSDLPTMWLKSANNFYSYRDNKIFIHLDSATGIARRLIVGITDNGEAVYTRQEFCYYLRTDNEIEPVDPKDYGTQILFDLELSASSSLFTPMEIFTYQVAGPNLNLVRFDMNTDIDWTYCPIAKTPWGFCDELRNGNVMYFPDDPDAATQTKLRNEAILIRSEYNYEQITQSDFDLIWLLTTSVYVEEGTLQYIDNGGLWKYVVSSIPDEPFYIGRAWREYMRYERPSMPDVDSPHGRLICYFAKRKTMLDDGSTAYIYGEVCYNNGNYTFTQ